MHVYKFKQQIILVFVSLLLFLSFTVILFPLKLNEASRLKLNSEFELNAEEGQEFVYEQTKGRYSSLGKKIKYLIDSITDESDIWEIENSMCELTMSTFSAEPDSNFTVFLKKVPNENTASQPYLGPIMPLPVSDYLAELGGSCGSDCEFETTKDSISILYPVNIQRFIYDTDSGILQYERWFSIHGDEEYYVSELTLVHEEAIPVSMFL